MQTAMSYRINTPLILWLRVFVLINTAQVALQPIKRKYMWSASVTVYIMYLFGKDGLGFIND